MEAHKSLFLFAAFLLISVISCSHSPREPAAVYVGAPSVAPGDLIPQVAHSLDEEGFDFGDSCNKSKGHVAVLEQAIAIQSNPYFQQLIKTHYSGYEPKLAIAEAKTPDCKNCMRIRFLYAKEKGLRSIEVMVLNGKLMQTNISRHDIDFSTAPAELKKLISEIPNYDEVECELSGPSGIKSP